MCEYARCHDYSMGFTCVADLRDVNLMALIPKLNILDMRKAMTITIVSISISSRQLLQ